MQESLTGADVDANNGTMNELIVVYKEKRRPVHFRSTLRLNGNQKFSTHL